MKRGYCTDNDDEEKAKRHRVARPQETTAHDIRCHSAWSPLPQCDNDADETEQDQDHRELNPKRKVGKNAMRRSRVMSES
mmetsp:Transcript_20920/g.30899  ORF Transcript_20920/g.30899 Transcript_20920/m.30899 type:complete len:80 (+) Transcript_20920:65-304(+)